MCLFTSIISFRQTEHAKILSTSYRKFMFNIIKFSINFWKVFWKVRAESLLSEAAEFSVRIFPAARQDLSFRGLCWKEVSGKEKQETTFLSPDGYLDRGRERSQL